MSVRHVWGGRDFYFEIVLLCSPSSPDSYYVDQASCEFTEVFGFPSAGVNVQVRLEGINGSILSHNSVDTL